MSEFATFLAEMHAHEVSFEIAPDGNVKVKAPAGVLTLEIQRAMKNHKEAILTWLASGIPLSFYLRSCSHCGRIGEAKKRDDGIWLCPCYWGNQQAELFASDVA